MDITQLRYFLKTAEKLNYTKAAEELFITRQSLRQALGAIEKELKMPLFRNERNKLSLTESGEYLEASAGRVVREFDRMMEEMARLTSEGTELNVAFSSSLFPFILPDTDAVLKAFKAGHPSLRISERYMNNDEVIDAVMAGEIDCGCVLQMPCSREGVTVRKLIGYPTAVSHNGVILKGREEIDPEDLQGLSCIGMGMPEKMMIPLWDTCREKGIQFQYECVFSAIDAFYRMEHGMAVGFDIYKTEVPGFDAKKICKLKGYEWEIAFLCSDASREQGAIKRFCEWMQKEYERRWARQRADWNAWKE